MAPFTMTAQPSIALSLKAGTGGISSGGKVTGLAASVSQALSDFVEIRALVVLGFFAAHADELRSLISETLAAMSDSFDRRLGNTFTVSAQYLTEGCEVLSKLMFCLLLTALRFVYLSCRNNHCAGTSAGAPLSLIKSTRNFAGRVPLAFRSTT